MSFDAAWKRWFESCLSGGRISERNRGGWNRRLRRDWTPATVELLGQRVLLSGGTIVFDPANGDQQVEVVNDDALSAAPIAITVNGSSAIQGNQLRIYNAATPGSNDLRQVVVLDTNGYLRAVHLDSDQPAGQQDGFGGSVVLGPTMVLSGGVFALNPQINSINIVTPGAPNGDIVLNLSGTINSSGGPIAGLSVTWTLTVPNTTPLVAAASGATTVHIEQHAHFATGVTLSASHEANAEGFRVMRFSNSYVDAPQTTYNTATHDADTALAYGSDNSLLQELDLATVPRGALLASGGIAGATTIRLEQRRPALLNDDPPNLTLRMINPVNPSQYRAQGFISNSNVDENSDNVDWYINQQFAGSQIAAGTDLSWTFDLTADDGGDLLPEARFLHDQANQYTISANPSDAGQPMIPIYTNANDRGMYMINIFHGGVSDNAADPDAFRGRTSYRMTIDTLGGDGYAIFDMGSSRPRDIPQIGVAHELRFAAKGDTNGQQIEVRVQTVSGLLNLGAAKTVTLSNSWSEYSIALPGNTKASDITDVHFVFVSTLPQGSGTVRLDEIRLSTDGFDPQRVLQSYVPLDSGGNTRDADFYHTAAFLYDNALAIKVLLYSGDQSSRQLARDIADAILMTQLPDGSFYDQLNSGNVANAGGVRGLFGERRAGDNLFLGLSMLEMARAYPSDARYYAAAVAIGNWVDSNLRAGGTLGGYYGGLDAAGHLLTYRATEHNLDAFEFYRQLANAAPLFGDAGSVSTWQEHATHAGSFVIQMFDNDAIVANRKFWTGTQEGSDVINTSSIPSDIQFWAQQTLGQSAEFGGSVDYLAAINWAIVNLAATDGNLVGFNFSSGAQAQSPDHVWLEGTAHAAVSFALLGSSRDADRATALNTLKLARLIGVGNSGDPHDGLGVSAASQDTITDPSFAFLAFDNRLHVGATAWTFFATKGVSPFHQLLSVAPVVDSFDTTVTYTAHAPAVVLDQNATVTDMDTVRFDGGVLTVSLIANADSNDRLGIGPVTRLMGVSGSNVTFRGTTIGTIAGGVGAADLVVTFNGNATLSAVQTVLRNLTFRSVSATPSTAVRTVQITYTDGEGGTSNLPTKLINVAAGPVPVFAQQATVPPVATQVAVARQTDVIAPSVADNSSPFLRSFGLTANRAEWTTMAEWAQVPSEPSRGDDLSGRIPGAADDRVVLKPVHIADVGSADFANDGRGDESAGRIVAALREPLVDQAIEDVFSHVDNWL